MTTNPGDSMKIVIVIYLTFGLLLSGMVAADMDRRCPNDPSPSMQEVVFGAIGWGAVLGYALNGPSKPKCRNP